MVDYLYNREEAWARRITEDGTHRPESFKSGRVEPLLRVAEELSPAVHAGTESGWGRAEIDSLRKVVVETAEVAEGVVPDVRGMGLKDALFLLESCGLRVQIEGSGAVVWQSLPPATRIAPSEVMTIRLQ